MRAAGELGSLFNLREWRFSLSRHGWRWQPIAGAALAHERAAASKQAAAPPHGKLAHEEYQDVGAAQEHAVAACGEYRMNRLESGFSRH
jgi:hypothetical protein